MRGDVVEEESPAVVEGDLEDAGTRPVSLFWIAMPRRSELDTMIEAERTIDSPLFTGYAVEGKWKYRRALIPVAATEILSREELSISHWSVGAIARDLAAYSLAQAWEHENVVERVEL